MSMGFLKEDPGVRLTADVPLFLTLGVVGEEGRMASIPMSTWEWAGVT